MEDEGPPIGLSEDEAFRPKIWVVVLAGAAILTLAASGVYMMGQGATLQASSLARGVWDFWGPPRVLGALFLLSGLGMLSAAVLAALRRETSLAVGFLGVLLFEVVMLIAVLRVDDAGAKVYFFGVMLPPFLALLPFQVPQVGDWLFKGGSDEGLDDGG